MSCSPFADSYLPITHFSELINEKVADTVTDFYYFELIKVTLTDRPTGVLPPPSSCQFAPCMLASLSHVSFFFFAFLFQELGCAFFLVLLFQELGHLAAISLKRPVFLAHCSWEIFSDVWPVSASLSLSFSSYKQEQR